MRIKLAPKSYLFNSYMTALLLFIVFASMEVSMLVKVLILITGLLICLEASFAIEYANQGKAE